LGGAATPSLFPRPPPMWKLFVSFGEGTTLGTPVWICKCHHQVWHSIIRPTEHRQFQHYNWLFTSPKGEVCHPWMLLIWAGERHKYVTTYCFWWFVVQVVHPDHIQVTSEMSHTYFSSNKFRNKTLILIPLASTKYSQTYFAKEYFYHW
jgi:hypothetical protein